MPLPGALDENGTKTCEGEGQMSLRCTRLYEVFDRDKSLLDKKLVACSNIQQNYKNCKYFWTKYCRQKQLTFTPIPEVREQILDYMGREYRAVLGRCAHHDVVPL